MLIEKECGSTYRSTLIMFGKRYIKMTLLFKMPLLDITLVQLQRTKYYQVLAVFHLDIDLLHLNIRYNR